jgi:uncharacterized protein (DUF952 family)
VKIFHIVKREDWGKAKENGLYIPLSISNEGFIHCSRADQVLLVANSFFKNQKDLIIIRIDVSKVSAEIRTEAPLEAPWSDILYPHIYGGLNIDAVEAEIEFPCGDDGLFILPKKLL